MPVPGTDDAAHDEEGARDVGAEHRVAVITGSAAGIGLAMARAALARGMRVAVTSRSAERMALAREQLDAGPDRLIDVLGDLRDAEQVDRLVHTVDERFGRIDLWVNNAAGQFFAHAEDITPNGWRAIVETNLTAPFLCCRAVFPVMRRQGGGSIVNMSSIAAYRPHPGAAHYAAAKAGLNSLTETLAVEWAPYGIRVNGVALGPVLTEASRFNDPVQRAAAEAEQPTGRIATAEEVAEVVLALAAIESPTFTGETVRVDGGFRSVLRSPLE
jgi:NAD(P)-dependent dehydrogenase (short-subunit alcohol dehydrogenase family)